MSDLLPPNATAREKALGQVVQDGFNIAFAIDALWSPDLCPIELLPYLAWALSVDHWDDEWTDTTKRSVVSSAVYVHRYKGTKQAVQKALEALDLGVTISQWFEAALDNRVARIPENTTTEPDMISPTLTRKQRRKQARKCYKEKILLQRKHGVWYPYPFRCAFA